MKKIVIILLFTVLSIFSYGQTCACWWVDNNGDYHCKIYNNCGNANFQDCVNPSYGILNQPTTINGGWYQGSSTVNGMTVCDYYESIYDLPIELTLFTVEKTPEHNLIKWQTSSEHNNNYFLLERSITGEFTENDIIYIIDGAGNSTQIIDYTYIDSNPPKEINYYRLTQVDFDGNYTQYNTIAVNNSEKKNIVKSINLMGQEVDSYYKGFVFEIYDDGTINKVIR